MTSHFGLLALFALFVAVVFAVLMRDDPRAQVQAGLKAFGGFVVSAVVLGWLMYGLPL
jgi:hypothetical protein